jgi:hypothetical protein
MTNSFQRVINTDVTVREIINRGGSVEDCVVSLAAQKEELIKRVMKLEAIAPKKITHTDGTVFVWHCPDELVPESNT